MSFSFHKTAPVRKAWFDMVGDSSDDELLEARLVQLVHCFLSFCFIVFNYVVLVWYTYVSSVHAV